MRKGILKCTEVILPAFLRALFRQELRPPGVKVDPRGLTARVHDFRQQAEIALPG